MNGEIYNTRGFMRVLVGCEESQEICKAFRARGHDAFSCDLKPCSGGHPEWHIIGDVRTYLYGNKWDLFIVHPPCDHIAVSGARYFKEKVADGRQGKAIAFFMEMTDAPVVKVCIENPVGIMSTLYRKPDQYIEPYQFGHPETKKTCLWLKGLPKLVETNNVYEDMMKLPVNIRNRIHYMPPSKTRAADRARTYTGWATAMAEQWG